MQKVELSKKKTHNTVQNDCVIYIYVYIKTNLTCTQVSSEPLSHAVHKRATNIYPQQRHLQKIMRKMTMEFVVSWTWISAATSDNMSWRLLFMMTC